MSTNAQPRALTASDALEPVQELPDHPTLVWMQCVLMPQGEVIHGGKTVGWFSKSKRYLRLAGTAPLWLLLACRETAAPPAPATLEDAVRRLDEVVVQLNWAQRDVFARGGRDIVVFVQLDSTLAPHYLRLPRRTP